MSFIFHEQESMRLAVMAEKQEAVQRMEMEKEELLSEHENIKQKLNAEMVRLQEDREESLYRVENEKQKVRHISWFMAIYINYSTHKWIAAAYWDW